MAKDTEKLIRQLSLISYLMAERRPVTAQEIRRDVEGYSVMNEDAFARRFYADRSELEALRIFLSVEKPVDGLVEQETYSLAPENFHLPPIEFTDRELAGLHTALHLLDGEFAYAEPLRLALQQISWGRPSPLSSPEQHTVALGITGSAGGHELSQRLAKIETAIFRRKTIVFDYFTMERGELGARKVDPYQLLFQGGQFYLVGHAHERERDPRLPAVADPRQGRLRDQGRARLPAPRRLRPARVRQPDRLAVRRPGGHRRGVDRPPDRVADRASLRPLRGDAPRRGGDGDRVFVTPYANARQLIAWVLGLGEHARIIGPPELVDELRERVELLIERHTGEPQIAAEPSSRGLGRRADRRAGRHRQRPSPRRRDPPRAVRPAGDAREHPDRRRPRRPARRRSGAVHDAQDLRAGAARGHLGAEPRQLRRGHVRPVRRARRRRDDRGRSRALRRLVRPPGAAAAGRGQGAGGGDRPDRRAHPGGVADLGAREGGRRARRGSRPRGPPDRHPRRRRRRDRRGRLARDRPGAGCCRSSTTRRTRTSSRAGPSSRTR